MATSTPIIARTVDLELRLECVSLANGHVHDARLIYEFVTGQSELHRRDPHLNEYGQPFVGHDGDSPWGGR